MSTNLAELKAAASAIGPIKFTTEGFEQTEGRGQFYGGLIMHENGHTIVAQCVLHPWDAYFAASNPAVVLDLIAQLEAAKVAEQPSSPATSIDGNTLEYYARALVTAFNDPTCSLASVSNYVTDLENSLANAARLSPAPVEAQATLTKLCDQIDSMRRTKFLMPGTGQHYSYLLLEDVSKYVEDARTAIKASTNLAAPVEAKRTEHKIINWGGGVVTTQSLIESLENYSKIIPGAIGRAQWAMKEAARYIKASLGRENLAATSVRDAEDAARFRELNTPEIADFIKGVEREAMHQRARWGNEHDAGKAPEDWFWLLGYLGGKALHAAKANDTDKALHHTISSAAALLNWHAAILGTHTAMRPGIETPSESSSTAASNSQPTPGEKS